MDSATKITFSALSLTAISTKLISMLLMIGSVEANSGPINGDKVNMQCFISKICGIYAKYSRYMFSTEICVKIR